MDDDPSTNISIFDILFTVVGWGLIAFVVYVIGAKAYQFILWTIKAMGL